jgi:CheY-like chemotaxis protein
MATDPGRLLLLLASRDLQTAAQLAIQVQQAPLETLRQLQQLVTEGFLVVATGAEGTVYHLRPKHSRADTADLRERVLVVEQDHLVRRLAVMLLEEEQYVVITAQAPVDAMALLEHVTFDLVITSSFRRRLEPVLLARADLLQAAGATPVGLFTAYRAELPEAQAAGFAGLLAKPFAIEDFVGWVRGLLTSQLGQGEASGEGPCLAPSRARRAHCRRGRLPACIQDRHRH